MATKGKLGLSSTELNTPILRGLEFLCQNFGAEIDAWERRAYERTLAGIDPGVVAEAAQLLVDEAAAGRKFFPIPKAPDWKGACVKVIQKRRVAAAELHKDCDVCHGSRWIDTPQGMARCGCHVRMMAAMDAVGKLLELPEASAGDER